LRTINEEQILKWLKETTCLYDERKILSFFLFFHQARRLRRERRACTGGRRSWRRRRLPEREERARMMRMRMFLTRKGKSLARKGCQKMSFWI
jgi:hypothetical protein